MASQLRHHSLVAWQRADDLAVAVYDLTQRAFPSEERYGLTSQTRRAALSVPLNIVEGMAREHPKELVQFLRIAWASLAEVGYCLHIAHRLGYLDSATFVDLDTQVRKTAAPLVGLIRRYRSAS